MYRNGDRCVLRIFRHRLEVNDTLSKKEQWRFAWATARELRASEAHLNPNSIGHYLTTARNNLYSGVVVYIVTRILGDTKNIMKKIDCDVREKKAITII